APKLATHYADTPFSSAGFPATKGYQATNMQTPKQKGPLSTAPAHTTSVVPRSLHAALPMNKTALRAIHHTKLLSHLETI
ncbi:hypothetical protein BDQ17DRAFT_1370727, partial [Cyathus striatus]